jgi:hypothetical protein
VKTSLFVAALALAFEPALAAPDPRADDAIAVYDNLCVSMMSGKKASQFDPARFAFTKISEENGREIKPDVEGPLWDVSGRKSDVHMLVHYEPSGMCVVEVAQADEATIRADFERLVQQTSKSLNSAPQREPDKRNSVDGKDATTSMWRVKGTKGDIMLAITTYPEPKFMIQHLMSASYVK